MGTSRLKATRTDIGVNAGLVARTGVAEARKIAAIDQPEVGLDCVRVIGIGYTEPGGISERARRSCTETHNVIIRLAGITLGVGSGLVDLRLLDERAATVGSPLIVDAGDGECTRQVDINNIFNSGVEIIGSAISVDVGEEVRRLDGVVSSAR